MKNSFFLLLLSCIFASCYSYKIYPKEYREAKVNMHPKDAFVINPELKKEYEILDDAKIYHLVQDSSAAIKIKLYKMRRKPSCGQGGIVTLITLGQVPVTFPDYYFFAFDEMEDRNVKKNRFQLKIAQRVWFWDMLSFKKRFNEKAGLTVAGNYYAPDKETVDSDWVTEDMK